MPQFWAELIRWAELWLLQVRSLVWPVVLATSAAYLIAEVPSMATAIAERLLARPGDWPPASPNARSAAEAFDNLLELIADGSAAAAAQGRTFADAGGIRAVVALLDETAMDIGRRAVNLDTSNQRDVQMLMMLGDVQSMGCTLLSNLAAFAGVEAGGETAISDELKISNSMAAAVTSLRLYPDSPEHVEAGLAALTQILPIDPRSFLTTGAHELTVKIMLSQKATTWPLYLCARAIMRCTDFGDVPKDALRQVGAATALQHALSAPPGDPNCGREWGVADVPAKLKEVVKAALEALAVPGEVDGGVGCGGGGGGDEAGGAHFCRANLLLGLAVACVASAAALWHMRA